MAKSFNLRSSNCRLLLNFSSGERVHLCVCNWILRRQKLYCNYWFCKIAQYVHVMSDNNITVAVFRVWSTGESDSSVQFYVLHQYLIGLFDWFDKLYRTFVSYIFTFFFLNLTHIRYSSCMTYFACSVSGVLTIDSLWLSDAIWHKNRGHHWLR